MNASPLMLRTKIFHLIVALFLISATGFANGNGAPVLTKPSDLTRDEDFGIVNLTLTATDPESDPISVTAFSSATSVVSINVASSTLLQVISRKNQHGSVTISITASATGGTDTETFAVTVDPINDSPAITNETGGDWSSLGGEAFASSVDAPAIAVDSSDAVYVAYEDLSTPWPLQEPEDFNPSKATWCSSVPTPLQNPTTPLITRCGYSRIKCSFRGEGKDMT
ncbi:hypothetical protein HOF92_05395 [bacterium]|jgi:hypothetical protein|nr:hypothetical protein [bacterium]